MPGPGAYWIGKEEEKEILEVLSGKYPFRYGDPDDRNFKQKTYALEQQFAEYSGVNHAIAVTSGTAALFTSLLAMGISEGAEVIVPGYTFIASISSIIYARAVPVLAEIDDSLTLDPADVEKKITKRTKAIMPVHMLGNPCNMDSIMEIARRHKLLVLEDACQAAGASFGSCKLGTMGNMGTFSLNIFKTITAGDGGIIVTDDDALFERAFGIHDQGHLPNRCGVEVGNRSLIGLNFRMNELTAACALAQLNKLDRITKTLRTKKTMLKERISGIPGVSFRKINDRDSECGTLLTVIFDDAQTAGKVASRLNTLTVSSSGWHVYNNMEQILDHKTPVSKWSERARFAEKGALPVTDDILSRSINISIGVVDGGLGAGFGINIDATEQDIDTIADRFRQACATA